MVVDIYPDLGELDRSSFAMIDGVNEGTAICKAAPRRSEVPDQRYRLTLDADGKDLPADWYLRIARHIADMLHDKIPAMAELTSHSQYGTGISISL